MQHYCDNCDAVWAIGTDEYDYQQCSACGWKPGMPTDDERLPDDLNEDPDFFAGGGY